MASKLVRSLLLATLAFALAPRPASACEPLRFDVDFVLPRADGPVPTNGVLLAYVTSPLSDLDAQVFLRDADDVAVEIEIDYTNGNYEFGLVRARPLAPLDPSSSYVWQVGPAELAFTTAATSDDDAPSFGEIELSNTGIVGVPGCLGEYDAYRFLIDVTEVSEPAALELRWFDDSFVSVAPSWDAPIELHWLVQNDYGEDPCFLVYVNDPAGHRQLAGETCLGIVDEGDDGSSEETETGAEPIDTETGADAGLDDDLEGRGCGCRTDDSSPRGRTLALLLLAGLTRRRRPQ